MLDIVEMERAERMGYWLLWAVETVAVTVMLILAIGLGASL
jgi:hypothetical protein